MAWNNILASVTDLVTLSLMNPDPEVIDMNGVRNTTFFLIFFTGLIWGLHFFETYKKIKKQADKEITKGGE